MHLCSGLAKILVYLYLFGRISSLKQDAENKPTGLEKLKFGQAHEGKKALTILSRKKLPSIKTIFRCNIFHKSFITLPTIKGYVFSVI